MAEKIQYEINGRIYTFTRVCMDGGLKRGYNAKRRNWAYLYPTFVWFDNEQPVPAKMIS